MFQLYLLLRLKNFGRIVIELGIFRIVFLTILTVAAIMILFLAENRFVIPVVCVLLLASYHNYRKDKEFLHTLTSHLPVFLIKEYTLITLPFAGMEMIKGRFTEAIGLWLFATLLPFLKEIKLEHKPIRLPFLYKGSYEYIRMFRQSFWIYALLLLFSIAGTVHGNIKIPAPAVAGSVHKTLLSLFVIPLTIYTICTISRHTVPHCPVRTQSHKSPSRAKPSLA